MAAHVAGSRSFLSRPTLLNNLFGNPPLPQQRVTHHIGALRPFFARRSLYPL